MRQSLEGLGIPLFYNWHLQWDEYPVRQASAMRGVSIQTEKMSDVVKLQGIRFYPGPAVEDLMGLQKNSTHLVSEM